MLQYVSKYANQHISKNKNSISLCKSHINNSTSFTVEATLSI